MRTKSVLHRLCSNASNDLGAGREPIRTAFLGTRPDQSSYADKVCAFVPTSINPLFTFYRTPKGARGNRSPNKGKLIKNQKRYTPNLLTRYQQDGREMGVFVDGNPWHRVLRSDTPSRGTSHPDRESIGHPGHFLHAGLALQSAFNLRESEVKQ